MNNDPELQAMNMVLEALSSLDEKTCSRVLDWAFNRFAKAPTIEESKKASVTHDASSQNIKRTPVTNFSLYQSIADLFADANAETESEKVLLVAAYLQDRNSPEELTSRDINKELQHLGYGVKNITQAISGLMDKVPKLMIQTRKEGTSQQAQKKYKVTVEGQNAALKLLNKPEEN